MANCRIGADATIAILLAAAAEASAAVPRDGYMYHIAAIAKMATAPLRVGMALQTLTALDWACFNIAGMLRGLLSC